ncbi:MAG: type II secretion system protein GspJ, partial [Pseudomonadota bacterium]
RRVWDVLDRVPETGYEETVLLSDLDDVSWSFYRNGWVEFWPLANDPFSQSRLPRAVKFTLSFADGRTIDRIIMIDHQG